MQTKEQMNAMIEACNALVEAVEASEPNGVPSGHLYGAVMGLLPLSVYQMLVDVLVRSNRLVLKNHTLRLGTVRGPIRQLS